MPFENPSSFPVAAKIALEDTQLRRNLGHATRTIREKRELVVAELPDWQDLREAGRQIKDRVMRHLPAFLEQLEASITKAGGVVHWARDAEEANRIVSGIVQSHNATEVIKVKSITTDEIGLNDALEKDGIQAIETDLAELIVQLAHDHPSHILVPAIHKNRAEIRGLFLKALKLEPNELTDDPKALADAARTYLRRKFLETKVAISGANFAIAETGTVGVVESEGNGRMCLTLPEVLISVMGIEKVLPELRDLEVMLQLLPRSSTAERMNPYTSLWTGVHRTPEGLNGVGLPDGPQEFHFVLLDNGRTQVLEDEVGRQALHCIRCSACLNVCPVYERTGGHAYGSVYPGPIGAILTPQLIGLESEHAQSLPFASSLCGACYEVCPVKINIPEILIHLRGEVVKHKAAHSSPIKNFLNLEAIAMKTVAWTFSDHSRYELAQKAARVGQIPIAKNRIISSLPGLLSGWTNARDLPAVPAQSFREWWLERERRDDKESKS
jgi:L-lactate dehydrogenase complex protein LldF